LIQSNSLNYACSRTGLRPAADAGVMHKSKIAFFLLCILPSLTVWGEQLHYCPITGDMVVGVEEMLKNGEYEKVIQKFLPSAINGDPASQSFIGTLYWKNNPAEAMKWSRLSVDNGCIEGTFLIANAYRKGIGVEKDAGKAFKWFMRAAESGDMTAASMISAMYQKGEGVELSEEKSIYWLHVSRGDQ
jgi:hypothetical protein